MAHANRCPGPDPGSQFGVDDGARTHDRWNHNPELYQLSYAHHCSGSVFYPVFNPCCTNLLWEPALPAISLFARKVQAKRALRFRQNAKKRCPMAVARALLKWRCGRPFRPSSGMARPAGLEPATVGLALPLQFSLPRQASLWSGLSLHHLRCRTYSLYGALR